MDTTGRKTGRVGLKETAQDESCHRLPNQDNFDGLTGTKCKIKVIRDLAKNGLFLLFSYSTFIMIKASLLLEMLSLYLAI